MQEMGAREDKSGMARRKGMSIGTIRSTGMDGVFKSIGGRGRQGCGECGIEGEVFPIATGVDATGFQGDGSGKGDETEDIIDSVAVVGLLSHQQCWEDGEEEYMQKPFHGAKIQ